MGLAREASHILLDPPRLARACVAVRYSADEEGGWG